MENNKKTKEALLKSVSSLSDEQINEVVEEGKWTIAQVLEHLYLIEVDATRVIQESLLNNEYNLTKSKPVHLAVDRTYKVKAQENWVPSNEYQALDNLKHIKKFSIYMTELFFFILYLNYLYVYVKLYLNVLKYNMSSC